MHKATFEIVNPSMCSANKKEKKKSIYYLVKGHLDAPNVLKQSIQ